MEWIVLAMVLGLLPAFIAKSKGFSFGGWWLFGALIFPVALIAVILARPTRCPECREAVRPDAMRCRHCGHDLRDWQAERTVRLERQNRVAGRVGLAAIALMIALGGLAVWKSRSISPDAPPVTSSSPAAVPPARPAKAAPDPWAQVR